MTFNVGDQVTLHSSEFGNVEGDLIKALDRGYWLVKYTNLENDEGENPIRTKHERAFTLISPPPAPHSDLIGQEVIHRVTRANGTVMGPDPAGSDYVLVADNFGPETSWHVDNIIVVESAPVVTDDQWLELANAFADALPENVVSHVHYRVVFENTREQIGPDWETPKLAEAFIEGLVLAADDLTVDPTWYDIEVVTETITPYLP